MSDKKSKLIQGFEEYFANTSEEQLKKDLVELESYNQYGPDIEECLELGRQHCIEMMKELDMNKKTHKINEDVSSQSVSRTTIKQRDL